MSTLSTLIKFLRQAAALLLLPWLAWSCQMVTGDYDDEIESSAPNYINITISVSASNNPVTRAPQGGEYGDGTERGIDDRENKIENITLVFYQDNAGINTTSDDATVLSVERYAVRPFDETNDKPNTHSHKATEPATAQGQEVLYTTGNQKLDNTQLVIGQTYKVLVVANADLYVKVGDKIKDVRDQMLTSVYTGTGIGINASNFVMTSETDATVTLSNPTIDTSDGENKMIFYLDCIHIERLAARIDFWAKTKDPDQTSTYIPAQYDADTYDHAGYVYKVGEKDANEKQDHFVLTSITPFNVMNGDEYFFKRTNDTNNPYLADETTSNWVLDPYSSLTGGKSTAPHPDYIVSPLTSVKADMANDYNIVLSTRQTASTTTAEGTKFSVTENGVTADNIIIGYPKENTLNGGITPLYYYATGLAFEGYYYTKNATQGTDGKITGGTRKVFYHYLRHQGEQDAAYSALTDETLDTEALCPTTTAMNFGIVRNNIYRVSIESITPDGNNVTLLIKVKKWDKFVHAPIYM